MDNLQLTHPPGKLVEVAADSTEPILGIELYDYKAQ
jgi:hypothetical protein